MLSYDNKRVCERFDHDAPIIFAYPDSDQFFNAKMCDFCKFGMGFTSGHSIQPGADIYIMAENYAPDAVASEIYDGYLANVKWCRKVSDQCIGTYRVGVKYYQTVIR